MDLKWSILANKWLNCILSLCRIQELIKIGKIIKEVGTKQLAGEGMVLETKRLWCRSETINGENRGKMTFGKHLGWVGMWGNSLGAKCLVTGV